MPSALFFKRVKRIQTKTPRTIHQLCIPSQKQLFSVIKSPLSGSRVTNCRSRWSPRPITWLQGIQFPTGRLSPDIDRKSQPCVEGLFHSKGVLQGRHERTAQITNFRNSFVLEFPFLDTPTLKFSLVRFQQPSVADFYFMSTRFQALHARSKWRLLFRMWSK